MTTAGWWRYITSEAEHESLMNGEPSPVYGVDYICDRDGDILVPPWRFPNDHEVEVKDA